MPRIYSFIAVSLSLSSVKKVLCTCAKTTPQRSVDLRGLSVCFFRNSYFVVLSVRMVQ